MSAVMVAGPEGSSGVTLNYKDLSFFGCLGSHLACFILASLYVGSLYVWKSEHRSTHPATIKKRVLSVATVTVLAPYYVQYFIDDKLLEGNSLWRLLGLRVEGLLPAMVLPLILTAILFMGPLSIEAFTGLWTFYREPSFWFTQMKDLLAIRNYIVAPITEEVVFRACMLVLIISCTKPYNAIFFCPVFFGAAHLHHMIEQIRFGSPWKVAFLTSCFQFMYTSVFGAYSAYLFLRTGHLIAPVIVHSFCNHMGFPNLESLNTMQDPDRKICIACFIGGVVLWALLLEILTEPSLYGNNLPWSSIV